MPDVTFQLIISALALIVSFISMVIFVRIKTKLNVIQDNQDKVLEEDTGFIDLTDKIEEEVDNTQKVTPKIQVVSNDNSTYTSNSSVSQQPQQVPQSQGVAVNKNDDKQISDLKSEEITEEITDPVLDDNFDPKDIDSKIAAIRNSAKVIDERVLLKDPVLQDDGINIDTLG